jgi:hypothetical protein
VIKKKQVPWESKRKKIKLLSKEEKKRKSWEQFIIKINKNIIRDLFAFVETNVFHLFVCNTILIYCE